MGKQRGYDVDATHKLIHTYDNFSGGMNLTDSDSVMNGQEFRLLQNVDLTSRGSIHKRKGYHTAETAPNYIGSAYGLQAHFYYRNGANIQEFYATGGEIFMKGSITPEVIKDADGNTLAGYTFQEEKIFEGIMFDEKLYIFTGTHPIVYDGVEWRLIKITKPHFNEYLHLGMNLMADDPSGYVSNDKDDFSLDFNGGIPLNNMLKGVAGDKTTFAMLVSWRVDHTSYEIKVERKLNGTETWEGAVFASDPAGWYTFNDRSNNPDNVSTWDDAEIDLLFPEAGTYDIRVSVRPKNEVSAEIQGYVPQYVVTSTDENKKGMTHDLKSCRYVKEHYGKLLIYGSEESGDKVYVSNLEDATYYPSYHYLEFESHTKAPVTMVKDYMGVQIAYTPNKIFSIKGKTALNPVWFPHINPDMVYSVGDVNTSMGCTEKNRKTIVAVQNSLFFLGTDGLFKLKGLWANDDRYNVERVDTKVEGFEGFDTEHQSYQPMGYYYNGKYVLNNPKKGISMNYDVERDAWTYDKSGWFKWFLAYFSNGTLSLVNADNVCLFFEREETDGYKFKDGAENFGADGMEEIEVIVKTPLLKQGYEFNQKKYKNIFLSFSNDDLESSLTASCIVNTERRVLMTSLVETYEDLGQGLEQVITDTPNIVFANGTVFGDWELGTSRFGNSSYDNFEGRIGGKGYGIQLELHHAKDEDFRLESFGYTFKLKKPKGGR